MNPGLSDLNKVRDLINELASLALVGDWEALSQQTEQAQALFLAISSVDQRRWSTEDRLAAKGIMTEILQGQAIISKQVAPWLTEVKQLLSKLTDNKVRSEQDS